MGIRSENGLWINPICRPLGVSKNGPFVELKDGALMTVDNEGVKKSWDDGKTWSSSISVFPGIRYDEPGSYRLLRTRNNAIVMVYLDFTTYDFNWDERLGEPKDDCRLELWAARSLDDGNSWTDKQRLLDGYNANFFGFIQTGGGRLVATVEHLIGNPGRLVACSLISDDEGRTWQRSNLIDFGGHGHHDGAMEPTVAELGDGRLLMLIRTTLDRFWQALSEDGGRYWRIVQPSQIDASNSPGYLLRLKSNRLALIWNRLNPEGQVWKRTEPSPAHERSASWHREELSIAISEDDGRSWTKPIVIARQKGGQLSYPYIFERRPGELWVIAGFAFRRGWKEPFPLRLELFEEDLVRETKGTRQ